MANVMHAMKYSATGLRGRRVKAILAGGLVLGVGAAVTMAAWNDSEFAQGTFTAGAFNLEGSTDNLTFDDHADVDSPAALGFTVNPENLAPGDVVSAPFAVRLDDITTTAADVIVSASATGGSVANLTYRLDRTTTFGCNLAGATNLVPAATPVGTVPGSPLVDLDAGVSDGVAGEPAYVCFTVTAGAGLTQSQTGTATWQFTATSTE